MFARREISIAADPRRLQEVRQWAAAAATEFGLTEDDCALVCLAISEAVSNAIQHGSALREDSVRLAIGAEGGALVFEVLDSRGFLSGPALPAGLDGEHGRGLDILTATMDSVELYRDGSGSLLRFAKSPSA